MKSRILIDCIASGQPRPYADSIYVYVVEFEVEQTWGPEKGQWKPRKTATENDAILAVKAGGRQFKTKEENPDWHETRLTGVEQLAENKFKVSLIQEFTD